MQWTELAADVRDAHSNQHIYRFPLINIYIWKE